MIQSEDISFVIQGPILFDKNNSKNLTSLISENIRYYYPKSEIILSTWEQSKVDDIIYDKLVINKDPGTIKMTLNGEIRNNNTNRMILSTLNGIKAASRKYIFRLRSDLLITNNNILNLDASLLNNTSKSVFNKKIIILPIVIRFTHGPILFSYTDWSYFALKEDLFSLYDIPLMDENNLTTINGIPTWENNVVSEQYLVKTFFQKFHQYDLLEQFKHMYQYTFELEELSNNILINNFLIREASYFSGLKSLKHKKSNYLTRSLELNSMMYEEDLFFLNKNNRKNTSPLFIYYYTKKILHFFYNLFRRLLAYTKIRILRRIFYKFTGSYKRRTSKS